VAGNEILALSVSKFFQLSIADKLRVTFFRHYHYYDPDPTGAKSVAFVRPSDLSVRPSRT